MRARGVALLSDLADRGSSGDDVFSGAKVGRDSTSLVEALRPTGVATALGCPRLPKISKVSTIQRC